MWKNCMVCSGHLFGGKLCLLAMVIVKAFDQAIWYLKIILPEDAPCAQFTHASPTSPHPLPIPEGRRSKPATKGLKKHVYSADGQTVVPPVSQAISQPGNQLGDEHTKIRKHYILSHSDAEAKFHGCEVPRLKCTGGYRLKTCTRQPWTCFFIYFFRLLLYVCLPSVHFPTSSQGKK